MATGTHGGDAIHRARPRGRLRRLRAGELLALAGAVCAIVSLFEPAYHHPGGTLNAWETFGAAVALLILAIGSSLLLVLATLTERSTALPVAAGVWSVVLALVALIATVVRLLERPDHATSLAFGAWLAFIGAAAMLLGAWRSIGDERTSLYEPARPEPRPRP